MVVAGKTRRASHRQGSTARFAKQVTSGPRRRASKPKPEKPPIDAKQQRRGKLHRETFTTSRLLEFCNEKELINQTGHPVSEWPLVILKELVDNAIDATEETEVAPVIAVSVRGSKIIVTDNGPGIDAKVVENILDYHTRTSSREAYAAPTRGAQGNALKTIVAMPFALNGTQGETVIESQEVAHRIVFGADHIRQQPKIEHSRAASNVKIGTRVTVPWPVSARSKPTDVKARFLQIASGFGWLNPHLTLDVDWDDERGVKIDPSNPSWTKWRPSDPTSPHWYDEDRLARLMGAYIARDQDLGRAPRTVREFIAEFRGLTATAKQREVLEALGVSRVTLPVFFGTNGIDQRRIRTLLRAMQKHTRPVEPKHLGVIGEDHLRARFAAAGADEKTFRYSRQFVDGDLPQVVEVAFGYCPKKKRRQIVTGVNWSPGIVNPFRVLGAYGQSLDTFLAEQRAGNDDEPITLVIHLACPRVDYTDRGKSALVISGEVSAEDAEESAKYLEESADDDEEG
jgi:DNA topoisomerase VI subunit B